ncbi:MAG: c-type cytochrome [Desulfosarcina sp.]|nr:c-type cytochrome [Desulfobacterales bacterium]
MINAIYQTLANIGYTHPLHPAITHVPVGLIIGGFLFALAAAVFKRPSLAKSARHCFWLALLALPLAALLGLMDWQHFYAGAWLTPIIMKMVLATILLALLLVTLIPSREKTPLILYGLCLFIVVGMGFFGGELVYGTRSTAEAHEDSRIEQGAAIFARNCAMCHYSDRTETRIGPGLKDLFQKGQLPISSKPVTAGNIESQIKTPYGSMPAFADMPQEEIEALIEYLKTL